jgi:hypothetical protein
LVREKQAMTRNGTGKIVAATTLMTILAGGTLSALQGAITRPAWKTKPTWYLIATEDRMIPPPAQRAMAACTSRSRRPWSA